MRKLKNNFAIIVLFIAVVLSIIPNGNVNAASTVSVTFNTGDVGTIDIEKAQNMMADNSLVSINESSLVFIVPINEQYSINDLFNMSFGVDGIDEIDSFFREIVCSDGYIIRPYSQWGLSDIYEPMVSNKSYTIDYEIKGKTDFDQKIDTESEIIDEEVPLSATGMYDILIIVGSVGIVVVGVLIFSYISMYKQKE